MTSKGKNFLYGPRPNLSVESRSLREVSQALEAGDREAVIAYLKSPDCPRAYRPELDELIAAVAGQALGDWPRVDNPLPDNNLILDPRQSIDSARAEADDERAYRELRKTVLGRDADNFPARLLDGLLSTPRLSSALLETIAGADLALIIRLFLRSQGDYLAGLLADNLAWLLVGLSETRARKAARAMSIIDQYSPEIYQDSYKQLHVVNWPLSDNAICDQHVFLEVRVERGRWRDSLDERCLDCLSLLNNSQIVREQEGINDTLPFGQEDPDCYTLLSNDDYRAALSTMKKSLGEIKADYKQTVSSIGEVAASEEALAATAAAVKALGEDNLDKEKERLAEVFYKQWHQFDSSSIEYRIRFLDQLIEYQDPNRPAVIHDSKQLTLDQVRDWLAWLPDTTVSVNDGADHFQQELDRWITKIAKKRGVKIEKRSRFHFR